MTVVDWSRSDGANTTLNQLLDNIPVIEQRAQLYAELLGRLTVIAPDAVLEAVAATRERQPS